MPIVIGAAFSGAASFLLKEVGLSIIQESIISINDLTSKATTSIENVKTVSAGEGEIDSPFGKIIKKENNLTSSWIDKCSFFQAPGTKHGVMTIYFKPFETNGFGPIIQTRSLSFYEMFSSAGSAGSIYKSNIEGTAGIYGLNSFLDLPEYSSLIKPLIPKGALGLKALAKDQLRTFTELKEFANLFGRKSSINSKIADTRSVLGKGGLSKDEWRILNGRVGGLTRQKNIVNKSLNRKTKNIGTRVFNQTGIPVANKQKASRILLKIFPFF